MHPTTYRRQRRVTARRPIFTEALERRLLLSAGELDPTFGGGGGIFAHPDDGRDNTAVAAAVQPDGKVIVAGIHDGDPVRHADFALTRYNPDGTIDPSFGTSGRVYTDFARGDDRATDVAVMPDGKIVVAGTSRDAAYTPQIAVARYNPNGTLDPTFDGDGRSLQKVALEGAEAAGVAMQPDGKLIVVGTAYSAQAGGPVLAVLRYLGNGSLDPSFDGDGKVLLNVSTGGLAAAVRPTGRIVVWANSVGPTAQAVFVGLNADGSLDSTFGTAGVSRVFDGVRGYPSGSRLLVQPDDKIVFEYGIAGATAQDSDVVLARLTPAGAPDAAFGIGGRTVFASPQVDFPAAVLRQADGRIVAGINRSLASNDPKLAFARVTAAGVPDPSFGAGGISEVRTPQRWDSNGMTDAVIQPGGRIVAAGTASYGGGTDFVLAGLTPAGALDPTFRSTNVPADPVGVSGMFDDVLLQPDGKILAVGWSTRNPQGPPNAWADADVYLLRLLPDGTPDPTFGTGGRVLADFGGVDIADRVALQSDGKIIVAGTALARFLPDGRLDTSFGGGDGFLPSATYSFGTGLAVQPDDKILVTHVFEGRVNRYTADGAPDPTFGGGGSVAASALHMNYVYDVAWQPNTRKILVAGDGYEPEAEGGQDWLVARLNADGTLDNTFGGGDGIASNDSDVVDIAGRLAVRASDGMIAMAGNEDDEDAGIALFNPDGSVPRPGALDRFPFYPGWTYDVAWAPDGKLVAVTVDETGQSIDVGRHTLDDIRVNRFNDDGTMDESFYSLKTDVFGGSEDIPYGVTVQPNGDIVVVGEAAGAPVVLRYQGSGAPEPIHVYADRNLVITGTPGADTLTMSLVGDKIAVNLSGLARSIARADVDQVNAELGDGNDTAFADLDSYAGHVLVPVNVFGGAGDDLLRGGTGHQFLSGDAGNDTLDGGAGGDEMSGGAGTDTVDYSSRTADLRVTIGDFEWDGEAGEGDWVREDVEIVRGGAGNDSLAERNVYFSEQRNALFGNGGNDTLDGGAGVDALFGGAGDDTLLDGEVFDRYTDLSPDYFSGGPGNDTIDYSSRTTDLAVSLDGVANDGRVAGPYAPAEGDNVLPDVENVIGGAGNDVISGSAAANRLVGNGGNDILRGGAGDDVLDGGAGRDWMLGGAGNDTADYSSRTADLRISLNGKFDDGEVGERDNVFADVENVIGGSGNDYIVGSSANNRLEGRGGNDTLTGGAGRDWLLGGEGDDTLLARDGITDFLLDGGPGTADRASKDDSDPVQGVETLLQA